MAKNLSIGTPEENPGRTYHKRKRGNRRPDQATRGKKEMTQLRRTGKYKPGTRNVTAGER